MIKHVDAIISHVGKPGEKWTSKDYTYEYKWTRFERDKTMADVYLRKKPGRTVHTQSEGSSIHIVFNEVFLNKANEPYLWLHWEDEEWAEKVFSSITIVPISDVDDSMRASQIVAKTLTRNEGTSSQLVTGLYRDFHSRLVTVTLLPVTFILCHKSWADFKLLTDNKRQLRNMFRQLMFEQNQGKMKMNVKAILNPPDGLLFQSISQSQYNSEASTCLDWTKDGIIDQRFQAIDREISKQKDIIAAASEKRKHQNNDIKETLVKLKNMLQSHDIHVGMDKRFDTGKSNTSSHSDAVVEKDVAFQGMLLDSDNSDAHCVTEMSDSHRTPQQESRQTCHHLLSDGIERDNDVEATGQSRGKGIFNAVKAETTSTRDNSNIRVHQNVYEHNFERLKDTEIYRTTDDTHFNHKTTFETKSETSNISDVGRQKAGVNPQLEIRKLTQSAENRILMSKQTIRSSSYLFPPSNQNIEPKHSSMNDGNQSGLFNLRYVCTVETIFTPEGVPMIRRTTNYTLSNGDREEKWSKVDEYRNGDEAPSIFEGLPYYLAPVQTPADVARPTPYDHMHHDPADIEQLLLRLDIGITKEQHPKLEMEHAAICLLNYMRDIFGKDDPVWRMVNDALLQDVKSVPRSITSTDTVLCLDSCGCRSRVHRLKGTAMQFLGGIEEVAEVFGLDENIAVVNLGFRAKIVHHLSNDYESLQYAIDRTEYEGTSSKSYLEGIMLCLAASTKGGVCNYGSYVRVPPRLIFITDSTAHGSMDHCGSHYENLKVKRALQELGSDFGSENVFSPIIVVPHGVTPQSHFKSMVMACNGAIENNISSVCNHQRIQRQSAQIIKYVGTQCGFQRTSAMSLDHVITTLTSSFDRISKQTIRQIVEEKLDPIKKDLRLTVVFDNINEEEGLPPLGTRVIRGPDWKWANEDSECAGTVINHHHDRAHLMVMWDNTVVESYRYGERGNYDVLPVDDRPALPEKEGCIRIGMQVERGPNWHKRYCDQDGGPGGCGTVVRHRIRRVMVRWNNGEIHQYRFGENGKYDLRIRDAVELLLGSQSALENQSVPQTSEEQVGKKRSQPPDHSESIEHWQWLDKDGSWIAYSKDINVKLDRAYAQRPDGSCLVQKDGTCFRVSFKMLKERSVADHRTTAVRRSPLSI